MTDWLASDTGLIALIAAGVLALALLIWLERRTFDSRPGYIHQPTGHERVGVDPAKRPRDVEPSGATTKRSEPHGNTQHRR